MPDREWLLDLAKTLQTTLDVERLIALFGGHVDELVRTASVEFRDPMGVTRVRTGTEGGYRCTYDFVLMDNRLGEIIFTRDEPFTERETELLEALLSNLVYPLRNALLYEDALRAATRDPLTGIHNRATFDGVIARETDLARRHGSQLSLLLVDADRFKLVNDTYGHLVGDCALKALAQTLAASIRGSDMVFRYGGEEFVLLLSGTPADGARRLAERVRASVEAESIRCEERTLRLTISLGVARYSGSESATELVERADIALYDAKRRGGNVVVVAEDVGTPGGEGGEAPPNPGGAPRS